jgi:hypothetical protein
MILHFLVDGETFALNFVLIKYMLIQSSFEVLHAWLGLKFRPSLFI